MNRNPVLTALFLGACCVGTWSWQESLRVANQETKKEKPEVAGYYLLNAGFVAPGPDGTPFYRLDARTMTYGVDSDLVEMGEVRIEYRQDNEADWVVTAPRGAARLDWQTLQLKGGVRVEVDTPKEPPVVLVTPDLLVDAEKQQATTASEVKFTWGRQAVDAVGMSVDLSTGLVKLESRVNGLFIR